MTVKCKRLLSFKAAEAGGQNKKSSSVPHVSIFLSLSLVDLSMQNNTKRSASDIRIATFRKTVAHNKIVKDEDMRKMLQCSVATYNREMQFYLQSMRGVIHDARYRVVGYENKIDELVLKAERS